jgi:DNA-binding CsgD family transcriptional regulator
MKKNSEVITKNIFKQSECVAEICAPLRYLEVKGFFFMRIFSDGTMVNLATHVAWGEIFFDNFLSEQYDINDITEHIYLDSNKTISLWNHNLENRIWQEGKENFNFGNGMSICKRYENYYDTYGFYAGSDNYKINNFYVMNLDIFEKFILYFNDKAGRLIEKGCENKLIIPNNYRKDALQKEMPLIDERVKFFLNALSNKQAPNYINLTKREIECLHWLCIGKTAYEISIILNCSVRTIEKHIDNIKKKFNCSRSTQVVSMAVQLGLN